MQAVQFTNKKQLEYGIQKGQFHSFVLSFTQPAISAFALLNNPNTNTNWNQLQCTPYKIKREINVCVLATPITEYWLVV